MKKLITLLMATIMMFALATSAWADNVTVYNETDLEAALSVDGNNITLGSNITTSTGVTMTAGASASEVVTVTLDLAGYNISAGNYNAISVSNYVDLTIKDSGATSGTLSGNNAIFTNQYGTVTIEGGTVVGGYSALRNSGTMTVNGGTFSYTGSGGVLYGASSSASTVVNGGTFSGSKIIAGTTSGTTYVNGVGTKHLCFTINAGTFTTSSTDSSTFLDYIASDSGYTVDGTTYTVKLSTAATIGDTDYHTLAEAMAAAKSGDTVKLISNATLEDDIISGVTLEVGASVTLTIDEDVTVNGAITNNGNIYNNATISGSGSIDNNGFIINPGTINVSVTGVAALTGTGTKDSPIEISSAAILQYFLTNDCGTYGELTADIEYDTDTYGIMYVNNDKTLDMSKDGDENGYTITIPNDVTEKEAPIYINAAITFNISGGTFIAGEDKVSTDPSNSTQGAKHAIDVDTKDAVVNVDNMVFYNAYYNQPAIMMGSYADLYVSDTTFNCAYGNALVIYYGDATVTDCTVKQAYFSSSYVYGSNIFATAQNGTINIDGGTYESDAAGLYTYSSGGTINVYGGSFTAGTNVFVVDTSTYYGYDAAVNVYGGEFSGGFSTTSTTSTTATITISGGTFENTSLTSETFAPYVSTENCSYTTEEVDTGVYTFTVTPDPYLVTIGEVGYYDWDEAVEYTKSHPDCVITLEQDITDADISATYSDNVYTIDLNGHTLSGTGEFITTDIYVSTWTYLGKLTIIDSDGNGELLIPDCASITNNGSLTLDCKVTNNGTITNNYAMYVYGDVTNGVTGTITNNNSMYVYEGGKITNSNTITNESYFTIYDGAIITGTAIVNNCAMVYESIQENEATGAVAYVEEDYYYETYGFYYYYYYGDLDTALNDNWGGYTVVMVKSVEDEITLSDTASLTLDLNGCTITGDITTSGSGTLYIVDGGENGKVVGTISGAVEISGGSYSVDPTSLLASGYTTVLVGEYYVVKYDVTQTINFGTSSSPYTTIVEGTEYFAEPTVVVGDVTLEGDFTYSYNSGPYVGYEAVIEQIIAANLDSGTFTIAYSLAVSGDYAGTVTGTIYFDYSAEPVVYSVLGNTIYAKLSLSGETVGKLSVLAPTELEYDGSTKAATIYDDNSELLGAQDISIVYTQNGETVNEVKNAGTYTASITAVDGEDSFTASITFTISRVSVSFTSSNNSFEQGKYYGEPTIEPSIYGFEDYTVSYTDADGNEVELDSTTPVGTYTIVVTITNSNYKLSGTVGSVVVYEVEEPTKYTVTFDEDGGSSVDDLGEAIATTVRTLEEAPIYGGNTFAGWTYNGKIYTAAAEFVQPEANVTMTATWIENKMTVIGTVTDNEGTAIEGATVTLKDGTKTTTDSDGKYSFSDVAVDTYTISVEYKPDDIIYTSSSEVYIKADTEVNFSLQEVSLSTKVVVEEGLEAKTVSNLSEVAAEILSEGLADENDAYDDFTTVEVNLIIASSNDDTALDAIENKTDDVGYTIDITIEKVYDSTVVEGVSETPSTIEIEIALPADIQGMATYKVYRYHVDEITGIGSVDILTTSKNSDGEYIELVKTTMTVEDEDSVSTDVDVTTSLIIHAKYFSTYAIASSDTVETTSSSSSTKKYSNDLEVGDNGSAYATPLSASSGTTVYINVSPDTGYEVDEVLVDDGDITVTDEGNNVYSYKQPAYAVDIEVTFVATDDVEEEEVEADENEALTDFEDVVAGAWYEEYIAAAVEAGIMQGNSTTEFAPNGTTTRAMMVQVLFNLEDQPETENDGAAWYSEALAWGMEFGITDGTEITGNLTREQLVTMLYRYAMSNGVDTSAAGDLTTFGDAENVADWSADAFAWAVGEGIINGDTAGNLNPDGNATRAELAKIMVSYLGL